MKREKILKDKYSYKVIIVKKEGNQNGKKISTDIVYEVPPVHLLI